MSKVTTKKPDAKSTKTAPAKSAKITENSKKTKAKISIKPDHSRDEKLSSFGKAVLKDRYLMPGENNQDLFTRVASYYADDEAHAQRLYDYISNL